MVVHDIMNNSKKNLSYPADITASNMRIKFGISKNKRIAIIPRIISLQNIDSSITDTNERLFFTRNIVAITMIPKDNIALHILM